MTLYEIVRNAIMLTPIPNSNPAKALTTEVEAFLANKFQAKANSPAFKEIQKLFEDITGRKVTND